MIGQEHLRTRNEQKVYSCIDLGHTSMLLVLKVAARSAKSKSLLQHSQDTFLFQLLRQNRQSNDRQHYVAKNKLCATGRRGGIKSTTQ